jgi:hypothetical protein
MGISITGDSFANGSVVIDFPFSDRWIAYPLWFAAIVAASPLVLAVAVCLFVAFCGKLSSKREKNSN